MKLYFKKSGEGKPLLILHGLFGLSDNWATLSKEFAAKGFLTYVIDARNHGRSPHSEDFSYEHMSGDLLELMDDEKLESAVLIGHSMGAKTAMWTACMQPQRVSELIVSDMAPRFYTPHHQSVIAAIHAVGVDNITSRKEAEARLKEIMHDEATVQFLLKNLYWKEEGKLAWRFYLAGIEKNMDNTVVAIPEDFHYEGRTLFLRGERSGYITDDDLPLIRKHFPNSELETVPNAGHWIHAENPAGFMQPVLRFLK